MAMLRGLRIELWEEFGILFPPAGYFPRRGGLLLIGQSINGDQVFLRTLGAPSEWTIFIIEVRSRDCEDHPYGFCKFLLTLLRYEIEDTFIWETDFDPQLGFVPYPE